MDRKLVPFPHGETLITFPHEVNNLTLKLENWKAIDD